MLNVGINRSNTGRDNIIRHAYSRLVVMGYTEEVK